MQRDHILTMSSRAVKCTAALNADMHHGIRLAYRQQQQQQQQDQSTEHGPPSLPPLMFVSAVLLIKSPE